MAKRKTARRSLSEALGRIARRDEVIGAVQGAASRAGFDGRTTEGMASGWKQEPIDKTVGRMADELIALRAFKHDQEPVIPMRLTCPTCGHLHVDKGKFAKKPHHTHACQKCGMTWRPAVVCTVGVQFLPGFKDETS